jgi:hypothetical protein
VSFSRIHRTGKLDHGFILTNESTIPPAAGEPAAMLSASPMANGTNAFGIEIVATRTVLGDT